MTPDLEPLADDVQDILRRGAPNRPLPPEVQARLLARAGAAVAASAVAGSALGATSAHAGGVSAAFGSGLAAKVGLAVVAVGLAGAGGWWVGSSSSPSEPPARQAVSAPMVMAATAEGAQPDASPPDDDLTLELALDELIVTDAASTAGPTPVSTVAAIAHRRLDRPSPRSQADEVAHLERVRVAIADGNLTSAARALAQHRHIYPDGSLAEEREALAVVVAARAGQGDRARQAAARFQRRFPSSAFATLVTSAIEALPDGR